MYEKVHGKVDGDVDEAQNVQEYTWPAQSTRVRAVRPKPLKNKDQNYVF